MIASVLRRVFAPSAQTPAHRLYIALVAQARQPFFYEQLSVPDTVDGRFDMILLHVFLLTHRLRPEEGGQTLARAITDAFFSDMDRNLREMGVGDMSVGKKIKKMAHALNGRFVAYEQAIGDSQKLSESLQRNVYAGDETCSSQATELATYCLRASETLAATPPDQLTTQPINWPVA